MIRTRVLFAGLLVFALLLVVRLYFVQVVHGEMYSARADRQYVHPDTHLFNRGSIYIKRRAENPFAAAHIKSGFTVAIDPRMIEHTDEAYYALSEYLDLEPEEVLPHIEKKDDPYEEIAHEVSKEVGVAIDDLGVPGVNIFKEQWRYYPGDGLAAQTIGFVAYDGDDRVGRYGLERQYNDILERKSTTASVNFFAELFTTIGETIFRGGHSQEGDIYTTLELDVQLALEEVLRETAEEWNSKEIGGIVLDPKTGAIVAMASLPSLNLNEFNTVEDSSVYRNLLVENVYEFGSIMKPLTMASGIDAGVVAPESTYNDKGSITLDGYTISNFDGRARGVVPMQEVLNQSLNTGVAFVADKLGHEDFRNYMESYGIGEESGVDLPNEATPITANLKSPRAIEYATASYGQGVALTPLQMTRALATLANGGVLITPHITEKIVYESGISKTPKRAEPTRALSEESSRTVSRMLVEVVDDALRGGTVKREHYTIAAKTGTAQMAKEGARGYYDDRYLHSFFGYFPAYEPRFLIFLFHTEPKGAQYSSETLTTPFMDMVDFLTNFYEIPPDR